MIVLEYPQGLDKAEEWKERLESMCIPHELLPSAKDTPKLSEGTKVVLGIEAVEAFLTRYEADVAKWNQDRCDMWFLD